MVFNKKVGTVILNCLPGQHLLKKEEKYLEGILPR
jgi:hypothetical protein